MLAAILALIEAETPDVIAFVQKTLPALIALAKGQGSRDAVLVALDAALEASRAEIDAELAAKYAMPK